MFEDDERYSEEQIKCRPLLLYVVNPNSRVQSEKWVTHGMMNQILGVTITEIRSGDRGGLCSNMFHHCEFCSYLRSRITQRKEW